MGASETFSRDNTALLLIDYQQGTIKLIRNRPPQQVARNGVLLGKVAKALGMPIVMTSSVETNPFQGPVIDELASLLPDQYDVRVQRGGEVDALTHDGFAAAVRATGRSNLVMAGVTTDVCLVHPACRAVRDGYRVQVVVDASGSNTAVSEDIALRTMEAAGVSLTSVPQLLSELAENWSSTRGAAILGEICGFGMNAAASDWLRPDPASMAECMELALRQAGWHAGQVGFINAHGTGTVLNDQAEALAIRQVFGHHAARLPVSSGKGMHGHALGASGALECIAALLSLAHGQALPNGARHQPDPGCALDIVSGACRPLAARRALSNSFAFGGLHAVLALGLPPTD